MATRVLSFSKDDYPNLSSVLTGQSVVLEVKGEVLDATDSMVTVGVKSVKTTKKSKLSVNEVVQQLAATRQKTSAAEPQP